MHIAQSVVNRILNVADGLPDPGIASAIVPDVPDTAMQGIQLDQKLAQPVSPDLPGLDQAPDPGATAGGAPLMSTLLDPKPGGF